MKSKKTHDNHRVPRIAIVVLTLVVGVAIAAPALEQAVRLLLGKKQTTLAHDHSDHPKHVHESLVPVLPLPGLEIDVHDQGIPSAEDFGMARLS